MPRRLILIVLGLVLAGCGGPTPSAAPVPPTAGHNDVDVMFLQMTLDYHRQAKDLVQLTVDRAKRPEVKQLATTMRGQWAQETTQMTAWLDAWGAAKTPDPNAGAHAGHGDVTSLRTSDVDEVRRAADADVDMLALNLLLGHQHNTVEVARMETAGGQDLQVTALATRIVDERQAQVQQMLQLISG